MKAASVAPTLVVLALASCGRHDTPLASYRPPSASPGGEGGNPAAGGDAGAGGAAASAGNAGSAGGAGAGGAPANELVCAESYTLASAGLTSRYRQVTTGRGWVEAERDCESDGGHLVVIDSVAENEFMTSIAEKSVTNVDGTHQLVWLGAGDSSTEGEFRWVTGSDFDLTFWSGGGGAGGANGEPNDLYDDEDCVEIRADGQWNDDRCDAMLAYVCECDGVPSAGEWCDSSLATSCGDCDTACPSGQSCFKQQCQ